MDQFDLRVTDIVAETALIRAIWANFRFYADDWLGQRKPTLPDGIARVQGGLSMLFEGIGTETAARAQRANPHF